jgi:hypothetical protein
VVVNDLGTMPMSENVRTCPRSGFEDNANAYFAVFNLAQATGNYAAAAKAQRLLARLGCFVSRRRPEERGKGAR